MSNYLRLLLVITGLTFYSGAQAQLSTGDIAFVGFNADGNDGLAIVTFVDIPANTIIFFTDNGWNGTAFNTNEGTLSWSTGGSIISQGTVVTFENLNSSTRIATIGTITSVSSGGSFNISAAAEVVTAYLGTANNPTTFLTAIGNNGLGNLTGTGLSDGVNAVNVGSSFDVAVYTGSTACTGTIAQCRTSVNNSANWIGEGGSGNQAVNSIAPNFPTDVPGNFGGAALPVELLTFEGDFADGVVSLSWSTASETDNDYFEILRSDNGKLFTKIGTVGGNGTSTTLHSYSFTDADNYNPVSYYQLKQVDYDGTSELFDIIRITPSSARSDVFHFYPNPAQESITLVNTATVSRLVVYDHSGRIVKDLFQDDLSGTLDLSGLKSGHYVMQVTSDLLTRTMRMVKN
ncbi:MAG: T9SS type A sorting domain-containing protein [Cyclobacteriaceae bacterium]